MAAEGAELQRPARSNREAVLKVTQRPVVSQWIHFSVGGGLVEVVLNGG